MNNIKDKVKAIIFDMDGTIIKTEDIWKRVTLEVITQSGKRVLTKEQALLLESLSGTGLITASRLVKEQFDLKESIEELVTRKALLAQKYMQESHIPFIDGFEQFHLKIRQANIPTSIATNADMQSLQFLSQKLNFSRFFGNNMFCVNDVENRAKPDPALFLHAARQLNALPEDCIVFEDSLVGFQAARAAGMKCIAIKNEVNHNLISHAIHAIDSYDEAEEILKKL